ncbi:hypothetical protein [Vibrio tasmaniensis]|uniref:hypothetical protein n=1 Tax=Vibrio tasmaniensis TaxID=212663 RepID=UPI000304E1C9|nr:hypothetical protein [Vibrio tasmaniensis]
MTWIIGGNCFNGFICVADIQATIEYPGNRKNKYFNCVQKIHKLHDNVCVAFSGDIRSGLLIVEDLIRNMKEAYGDNEYFDLDGQSEELIGYLKRLYKKINPTSEPYLELMFLWNAQEEDEPQFRPFCMKFKSPEFTINSTPMLGVAQTGFGRHDASYGSIFSFLSGHPKDTEAYQNLCGEVKETPHVWTVEKFKKLVFNEASKLDFPGVSKSLISYESVIPYKDIYPEWLLPLLRDAFKELGVDYSNKKTANDNLNVVTMDIEKMDERIKFLEENHKDKFDVIRYILSVAVENENYDCLCKQPPLISDQIVDEDEEIHSCHLIANWHDMEAFLKSKGVNLKACSAIA